jgi:plastocyanin
MRARRSMIALLAGLAVAFTLALALPSLGGPEQVRSERPQVEFTVTEYAISPSELSVRPGRIKFVLRNEGRLTHNVRVETVPEDGERALPACPDRPCGTPTAQPGQRVGGKLTLEPGVYRLTSTIGNQDDLGVNGRLVVEGEPLP